jgi:hypothetical protein
MSNYPPPPGQPPYPPPEGVPTRPMNPQPPQGYQHNPYGQQPPFPPPNQQPKKGGAGKYILIGCIGLFLIAGIGVGGAYWFVSNKAKQLGFDPSLAKKNPALAAARVAIGLDPDKEFISLDETNNTITVKDKKSGKVITLSVEQDKNGEVVFKEKDASGKEKVVTMGSEGIEVKSPDGIVKIGTGSNSTMPDWVPQYPGVKMEGTYSTENEASEGKGYSFTTDDSVNEVISFYEDKIKAQGFKTSKTTTETNGKNSVTVSGNDGNYRRFIVVNAMEQSGDTRVSVTTQTNKKK